MPVDWHSMRPYEVGRHRRFEEWKVVAKHDRHRVFGANANSRETGGGSRDMIEQLGLTQLTVPADNSLLYGCVGFRHKVVPRGLFLQISLREQLFERAH